jgi:predicted transposase YbfD/YdcC
LFSFHCLYITSSAMHCKKHIAAPSSKHPRHYTNRMLLF